ncbi:opioid growth factor receptor [Thalassophryne amazonica]|uniref:opioid growth factor receptor n=1 Tax=Thalassophryne amazonica TaxID=390379 RepID=UPI00147148E4|nr:opioid growth factor receptor [Thalassophryne amazonica]
MEDDCACDYDSTWDTESDGEDPAGESRTYRTSQDKNKSWSCNIWHTHRNMRAAKDMQNYRRGYPNLTDDEGSEDKMNNLQFYLNKFPSVPDDVYIESFHKEWKNDYKKLERVHSYIQWLFPLREPGVNYMASELTKKEIEAFKQNDDAKRRLVESYELMLGFYGIRLVNKNTGEVRRAENWKERFGNLERNMHNNLRITRILKSLGELGFKHYQAPLVQFFLEETLVKKTLSSVKRSVLDYFLFAVLDKKKRKELVRFAFFHFEPKEKFVWCPRKVQKQFKNPEKKGNEDVCSQAQGKDGETAVQQKDDGMDMVMKVQKDADNIADVDKSKLSEESCEQKTEAGIAGNQTAEADSKYKILENGNDCHDDVADMDQSPGPDDVTVKNETAADSESGITDNAKDPVQESCGVMATDGDIDTEKPPKKKRDDKVLPSNGYTEDRIGNGFVKVGDQTGHAVQTPLKTSKHSPSLSLGREEKIPRTEFNQVPDKKEEEQMMTTDVSLTNGASEAAECVDEPTHEDSEAVDMESNSSGSEKIVDNS